MSRVRYAGAKGQLTVRADSGFYTHGVVSACRKLKVRFSITIRLHKSLRHLIEAIPEEDWTPLPYWMDGAADVAETTYTPFGNEPDAAPVRLIVRRVKPTPGSQLALFATYSYHGFITDRDGEMLELEADHRRHAEIENAIRDLKYGVGLNHLPSGRFPSTTVAVNDDVKLRQLSVDEVRLRQSAGMRLRRWPVGPRASIRYTSASGDGSGGRSPAAGRWTICGDCSVRWSARTAGNWPRGRATPLPTGCSACCQATNGTRAWSVMT